MVCCSFLFLLFIFAVFIFSLLAHISPQYPSFLLFGGLQPCIFYLLSVIFSNVRERSRFATLSFHASKIPKETHKTKYTFPRTNNPKFKQIKLVSHKNKCMHNVFVWFLFVCFVLFCLVWFLVWFGLRKQSLVLFRFVLVHFSQ